MARTLIYRDKQRLKLKSSAPKGVNSDFRQHFTSSQAKFIRLQQTIGNRNLMRLFEPELMGHKALHAGNASRNSRIRLKSSVAREKQRSYIAQHTPRGNYSIANRPPIHMLNRQIEKPGTTVYSPTKATFIPKIKHARASSRTNILGGLLGLDFKITNWRNIPRGILISAPIKLIMSPSLGVSKIRSYVASNRSAFGYVLKPLKSGVVKLQPRVNYRLLNGLKGSTFGPVFTLTVPKPAISKTSYIFSNSRVKSPKQLSVGDKMYVDVSFTNFQVIKSMINPTLFNLSHISLNCINFSKFAKLSDSPFKLRLTFIATKKTKINQIQDIFFYLEKEPPLLLRFEVSVAKTPSSP